MVNDPFFHSLDEFSDETFEVCLQIKHLNNYRDNEILKSKSGLYIIGQNKKLNNLRFDLSILFYVAGYETQEICKYDLPLQLGYFVYQQAKLKMLEFYFDVVDRFIERKHFCLLEMDTGG